MYLIMTEVKVGWVSFKQIDNIKDIHKTCEDTMINIFLIRKYIDINS